MKPTSLSIYRAQNGNHRTHFDHYSHFTCKTTFHIILIPMEKGRLFRLNDNWVSVAIGLLDSFGDVGSYHPDFLEKLLPHCSKDQLAHIERCTTKVDLTPITNKLWKTFFQRDFGGRATDEIMQEMKNVVDFNWSEAYEAKSKRVEQDEKEVGERLKKMYQEDAARKKSREIKVLDKVPPPSSSCNKRIGSNKTTKPLRDRLLKSMELKRKMRITDANPYGRSSSFNPRRTKALVF